MQFLNQEYLSNQAEANDETLSDFEKEKSAQYSTANFLIAEFWLDLY